MVSVARPDQKPEQSPEPWPVWEAPAWYKKAVQHVKGASEQQNSSKDDPVSTDLSLGGLFEKGCPKDALAGAAAKPERTRVRNFKVFETEEAFVPGIKWRHLFDKRLTRSDVAKFNRLVIPSKYAKHFAADLPSSSSAGASEDVVTTLSFVDEEGKLWRFRYKYWAQSKGSVLTSKWIYFVRDKGLEAQDEISFYRNTETKRMAIGFTKNSAADDSQS